MNSAPPSVTAPPPADMLSSAKRTLVRARRHVMRRTLRTTSIVATAIVHAPITIAAVLVLWVLGTVTGSLVNGPPASLLARVGLGVESVASGALWVPLTAGLWAPDLTGYVVATLLLVAVVAPIEHRMGGLRFLVAATVTQIISAAVGVAFAAAARGAGWLWAGELYRDTAVGPTTWIAGVAMTASASMSTLWRRRLRVGVLTLLLTLALFGGHLQDLVRLLAAGAGLALGPVLVGRSARGVTITGTRREGRVLVATIVAASALGPILAALSPAAVGPLAVLKDVFSGSSTTPAEVRAVCAAAGNALECREGLLGLRLSGVGPTVLSLVPTLFVVMIADGLRRGRRSAWTASIVAQGALLALSIFNTTLRYLDSRDATSPFYGLEDRPHLYNGAVAVITPLMIVVILVVTRDFFDASAPAGTYTRFAVVVALAAGVSITVFVGGGLIFDGSFDPPPSWSTLLSDFPNRLIPPVYLQWLDPRFLPTGIAATVLFEWVGIAFWTTIGITLFATFLLPAYGADADDAASAQSIVRQTAGSSLSWMTTWRGNKYWIDHELSSFVAYRVIGGVALTTGGPVGPPSAQASAVSGFATFCADNGWSPCFYSVTADIESITAELGWSSMQVAEETVLDLMDLAFTGKRFQDVRSAINKADKVGVHAEWITYPTAPLALTDQITAISEEWVADKGMPEMGFTLGGLEQVDDEEVRCLIAVDETRTVHGVTSWLPVYRDGVVVGWTLDFMRRRTTGFRPAMEFLIASAALLTKAEGAQFLSLSGAPLATVPHDNDTDFTRSGSLDKLLDVLGRTLEPVYGFRSLLAFKSKFQPRYVPMYLLYADPAALPSIANAITRAYLPHISTRESLRLLGALIRRS